MQNLMTMLTFFWDQKSPFRADLDQKFKILCLKCILAPWDEYAVLYGDAHFICFRLKLPILDKLVKKFIVSLSWNVVPGLIRIVMSIFVFLDRRDSFLVNFVQ